MSVGSSAVFVAGGEVDGGPAVDCESDGGFELRSDEPPPHAAPATERDGHERSRYERPGGGAHTPSMALRGTGPSPTFRSCVAKRCSIALSDAKTGVRPAPPGLPTPERG